jgi:hypothetical protein
MDSKGYLSVPELAVRYGCSQDYIRESIEKGLIPGVAKLGPMWMIPVSAAGAFIARKQQRELFRIRKRRGVPDQPGKSGA